MSPDTIYNNQTFDNRPKQMFVASPNEYQKIKTFKNQPNIYKINDNATDK